MASWVNKKGLHIVSDICLYVFNTAEMHKKIQLLWKQLHKHEHTVYIGLKKGLKHVKEIWVCWIQKSTSCEPLGQFQPNAAQYILRWRD